MTKATASSLAKDELPCSPRCASMLAANSGKHLMSCPAFYRPAVASIIQVRDERITELQFALLKACDAWDRHYHSLPVCDAVEDDEFGPFLVARRLLSPCGYYENATMTDAGRAALSPAKQSPAE